MFLQAWARYVIPREEGEDMIRPIGREEVKGALFDIAEDKAPGPDGYSAGFFKAAWSVIGDELTTAIQDFFVSGKLLKQVNATVLSLIPKVANPTTVAEFRPISCCNVLYKAITKIIVQRMQGVMDKIIRPPQNAFVPGNRISNNILLGQELFHGYNRQNLPSRCALKGWSSLSLSFAARVQLLKSVILALNVYWAMEFILPKGVLKAIDARMRNFLWRGGRDAGVAKVAWVDVCKPLEEGGQGPLIHRFPRGPRVVGIPLEAKLSIVIVEGEWNLPLITDIEHMEIVEQLPPLANSDKIAWNSVGRAFSISEAYHLFQPPGLMVYWHGLLRGPFRIPRNCFILWLAILERLSTLDKAWWTGLDNTCVLCSTGEIESHTHLFF
ncbi:UNVERIFIED_CONTAM: LINE-1 retrotransposable element O protein [Sesamum latifolium]|uniref:LINE-1 retrotransposable element O protein n=1 Tax=Sesamum latifolium TaxID=2727402 RepID=A0AAW2UVG6_9LAMI